MDKEQLRKITEQLARPSGDQGIDISVKMNSTNSFITKKAVEALSPQEGEFIVELGPGNGELSRKLVQSLGQKGQYLGIEISDEMATTAEKNLQELDAAQVKVHKGDCHDISVEDGSVDALMAVNVLYFVENLDALLFRIRPWFKPDGKCVFGIRPAHTLKALRFHEFGYRIRSVDEIKKTMQNHGFGNFELFSYDEGEGSLGEITFPNGSIIIKALACN